MYHNMQIKKLLMHTLWKHSRMFFHPRRLIAGGILGAAVTGLVFSGSLPAYAGTVMTHASAPRVHIYVQTVVWASKKNGAVPAWKKFGDAYGFAPATIVVRQGDEVTLTFRNLQAGAHDLHTFTLPAYGISRTLPRLSTVNVTFYADKAGEFSFHCDYHKPWMSGELVVLPAAHGG